VDILRIFVTFYNDTVGLKRSMLGQLQDFTVGMLGDIKRTL